MAALSLLLVSSLVSAAATDGTLLWGIQKNTANEAAQLKTRGLGLQRRSGTLQADLGNAELAGLYYANVTIGTPPQDVSLQIDTGSSDVWVPSTQSNLCLNQSSGGCDGISFDSSQSSTFVDIEQGGFNISYADGTGSTGDYFQDTFSIGGSSIKSFEMGLALQTSTNIGIMGIAYNNSEANVYTGNGTVYANLPYALVDAGLINAIAYSLWLNDLQATTGSILFGGIDTDKYTGDLLAVDVQPTDGQISAFTVAFTSLSATSSSGSDVLTPANYAEAAVLDSGTTLTLLPNDVVQSVYAELGATISDELGPIVPCSLGNNAGTLSYGFGGPGGPTIKVAMSQLVLPVTSSTGVAPTFTNGETICQLSIQAAGSGPVLFGDTFLRSAYVVYDLDNNRIALAQTNFNSTSSNIVPFASRGASIPSASVAASQVQVSGTATGILPVTTAGTATITGGVTYNPTATGYSAASGFQSAATSTTSTTSTPSKKGAAAGGARPFHGAGALVGLILTGILLGAGGFALL